MHELSIAQSILERLEAEETNRPGARFRKVGLRIGELAGVDPEALRFGFEVLVKESRWDPLELEIEWCPRRQKCPRCRETFAVRDLDCACPQCGEERTTCVAGDELDIAYLEVEEPCACR